MAYTKVVQSGTLVEIWRYEREPSPKRLINPRPRRKFAPRRRRPDHIKRCKGQFRRLVRANLGPHVAPDLLTLTIAENIEDIATAYNMFTAFAHVLKKKFGTSIKWIAVPEFQKRGAVHFHVLIWGLSPDLACQLGTGYYIDKNGKRIKRHACTPSRQCERRSRYLAGVWKAGYVDLVRTDGSVKLSSYLAKYMSKAMHDDRLIGKRAYSASRNILRPVSLVSDFQIKHALSLWGVTVDNPPLQKKEYGTEFLGRCDYKSYLIEDLYVGTANSANTSESLEEGGCRKEVG